VITEHTICALSEDHDLFWDFAIKVGYRGKGTWAVHRRSRCLGTDGVWDYEPLPSERDDDWLTTHRFDEQTALRLAEEQAQLVTVNGITVQQAREEVGR
jgi:hypothetical protein